MNGSGNNKMNIKEIEAEIKALQSRLYKLRKLKAETKAIKKKEFLETLTEEFTTPMINMDEQIHRNGSSMKVYSIHSLLQIKEKDGSVAVKKLSSEYAHNSLYCVEYVNASKLSKVTYKVISKWKCTVWGWNPNIHNQQNTQYQCYGLICPDSLIKDSFIIYTEILV
jgi:hypothetical protein